ncbi:hypothetical protein MLD38_001603 [Melastoma candidum]|uniref:Uncharacterized protein n=1 Tax=Melastoma candidum TaxID=119954 RepID=A0ACB9SD29_9MYRT|nr:hypothetical protein MLD38_001603 [Melastoma candidum]
MQTLLLPSSIHSFPSSAHRLIIFWDCQRIRFRYPIRGTSFCGLIGSKFNALKNFAPRGSQGRVFRAQDEVFDGFSSTQLSEKLEIDRTVEGEALELRNKPALVPQESRPDEDGDVEKDDVLAPFLKFFKDRESLEGGEKDDDVDRAEEVIRDGGEGDVSSEERRGRIGVEYYEPKVGDFVVGVVVSGNENRLDVNVGADLLGTMLKKEVLPLYDEEKDYLLCDIKDDGGCQLGRGKMGIVKYDEAVSVSTGPGRPVVENGTVLFAEVLGRTLSGRPLLSTRRFFRRIAWHRVRQIKRLNEPIEVRILQWNTGGLLTRIEGLRAFIPKAELINRVNNFTEMRENVGRQIQVLITRMDEDKNDLVLSEKEAWEMLHLQEGTLLDGVVKKLLPYGAQIRLGDSNRSGLLHISKITNSRVGLMRDVLSVDEKVKVMVVKSTVPEKIALSIVDLESEPGLFLKDKQRVFSEAEKMAKIYRETLPPVIRASTAESPVTEPFPFHSEDSLYANWSWFKFERE